MLPSSRWVAADKDSEAIGRRSLRQLIAEKRKRVVKDRMLERNPGMARSDYTDRLDRAMRDEGAAVDKETQDRFSAEARERFEKQQKPLSERVRELEGKVRPQQ